MRFMELIPMALSNLWARKSRTVLNTFGIVISCALLLLVLAGTRGAQHGILSLFEQSDFARKFAIFQGYERPKNGDGSDAASEFKPDLPADMSKDRRERISKRLERVWKINNFKSTKMLPHRVEEFRDLPLTQFVLPTSKIRARVSFEHFEYQPKESNISIGSFSEFDLAFSSRVSVGEPPDSDNLDKVWISEYRAWRLGFQSEADLEALVGKPVSMRFQRRKPNANKAFNAFARLLPGKSRSEIIFAAETLGNLFRNAEQAGLNRVEVQLVEGIAETLGLDPEEIPAAASSQDASSDQPDHFSREFKIAGVFRPNEGHDLFSVASSSDGGFMLHWRSFEEVHETIRPDREYHSLVAAVNSAAELKSAVKAVEAKGYETRSALEVLERVDEDVWKVRLAVAALAGVVLLIASVGIMNTTVIAVMERTPEFGIMKAIGAKDNDIRNLVLIEAVLTAVLGVIFAYGLTRLIDLISSHFARLYLEQRLDQSFDFNIFVYSGLDFLLVVGVAIVVCMLASLLPSRRAAKLDPVVAMKAS